MMNILDNRLQIDYLYTRSERVLEVEILFYCALVVLLSKYTHYFPQAKWQIEEWIV